MAREEPRRIPLAGRTWVSSTAVQMLCHVTYTGVQGLPAAFFPRALLPLTGHSVPTTRDPAQRLNQEVS